ncbi:MAG TPA: heparan-alpha-glucosaminide N-acetyltransferase [Methanospirillum sp.]|nr:heparan-alpha-glucosaminide N-acetyltransferase [Methanospirillum sp.]
MPDTNNHPPHRFSELDACRGIAVMMMVIFHLIFDISFFSLYPVPVSTGFWRFFGYATAVLFVAIAGVAVSIRSKQSIATDYREITQGLFRRGLSLLMIGFCITVVTWQYLQGSGYVLFGILHLIGLSTMIAPLFLRMKMGNLILGVSIITAGLSISLPDGPLWLSWIGIHPIGFYSVDYTPLIPWLGVYLIGMGIGFWLYPDGKQRFSISDHWSQILRIPALPGRHSLMIYLVHQPILLLLLALWTGSIPGM